MTTIFKRFAMLLVLLLASCGILFAADIYVLNSESRTLSHIDSESGQVNNVFCQLGLTPNRFCLDADYIYVALSGDNAIQMISRQTGQSLRYITVAPSCNPWDVVKDGEYLYVTGLFTDKVYKVSLQSFTVVDQVSVGTAPEAMVAQGGTLYVTNTGGYQSGYANSSVSVIDLAEFDVVATIPVWLNPQYLIAIGDYIHVSCTGNWTNQMGKVSIINTLTNAVDHTLDIGGNLGGMWKSSDGIVYLGDGMNSGIYSYDAQSLSLLHTDANPLIPGGMAVSGTDSFIAVLNSLWGQNGTVSLRNADFSLQHTYTVALAPTDIQIYQAPVGNEDLVSSAVRVVAYPNPLQAGSDLHFGNLGKELSTVKIYNLRGQQIDSFELDSSKSTWKAVDQQGRALNSGIYIYRVQRAKDVTSGKFVIR